MIEAQGSNIIELPTLVLTRSGDKGLSQPLGHPCSRLYYTIFQRTCTL